MLLPGISWPGGSPENTGIVIGVIFGAYAAALWLAAIVATARDIRERTRDPLTQAVAVGMVLVFNLPGWVLYQVLRPPMTLTEVYERQLEEEVLLQQLTHQRACPECGSEVHEDYVACPHCATRLQQSCGHCGKPLVPSWTVCPWCATTRPAVTAIPVSTDSADPGVPSRPHTIQASAGSDLRADTEPSSRASAAGETPASPFRPARGLASGTPPDEASVPNAPCPNYAAGE